MTDGPRTEEFVRDFLVIRAVEAWRPEGDEGCSEKAHGRQVDAGVYIRGDMACLNAMTLSFFSRDKQSGEKLGGAIGSAHISSDHAETTETKVTSNTCETHTRILPSPYHGSILQITGR